MKPFLFPMLALLLAIPTTARAQFVDHGQQRPIAIEIVTDADSFKVTNVGPFDPAEIWQLVIRPEAVFAVTMSDVVWMPGGPLYAGDEVRFGFSLFAPGQWVEFAGPTTGTIEAHFVDTTLPYLNRGVISAPIENGTFSGYTVPEAPTWALIVAGIVAGVVVWNRKSN